MEFHEWLNTCIKTGNLCDVYLCNVEYTLNLYLVLQQYDTSRNGENHQRHKCQYERHKPRREESARVERVQQHSSCRAEQKYQHR